MNYERNTNCGHGWPTVATPLEGEPGWFERIAKDCPLCPDHKAGIPYKPGTEPKPPPPDPPPPSIPTWSHTRAMPR